MRAELCSICIWICLKISQIISTCLYLILINCTLSNTWNKELKNTRSTKFLHRINSSIPLIEFTNNRYTNCIWSPYCKISTFNSIYCHWMRTKLIINCIMNAFIEKVLILTIYLSIKCVRISSFDYFSIIQSELKAMHSDLLFLYKGCKETEFVLKVHIDFFAIKQKFRFSCTWTDSTYHRPIFSFMYSKYILWCIQV